MKELTLPAILENIKDVIAFVDEQLETLGCPVKAQLQIDVAIDELFGNIANYAYRPGTGPATVRVEAEENPPAVRISFIDHGTPYNPLIRKEPDTTLSADDREIGGLGIFIARKSMDEMSYEYRNGQNILTMKKLL